MPYIALENLLDHSTGSIYKMVILAAKRALEIAEGQPPLVEMNSSIKPSTIALHEISVGKIKYKKIKAQ
ncbi:MAG: DNA-directed RNA polymerase subunit omega [Candidatus Omnitrophota bacterium]|nr:MAG: DNA-directed RNA polymerase subunit omega [Candidatus Omnitrophota bacterium]